MERRNRNRGYQELRVWQDAVALYVKVCETYRQAPFERKKIAAQAMAGADSIHRNIAEGYCRRSTKEYLCFLNYALGSLGETTSGLVADLRAGHIPQDVFEALDELAFRLENGLLRMVEALERKQGYENQTWDNASTLREANAVYTVAASRASASPHHPNPPVSQFSDTPVPHSPIGLSVWLFYPYTTGAGSSPSTGSGRCSTVAGARVLICRG